MKVMLNKLGKADGQRLSLQGPIDMEGIENPHFVFLDFSFKGQAEKESDVVWVEGDIDGQIETKCTRCLASVNSHFQTLFSEQFSEIQEEEQDVEGNEIFHFEGGEIHLDPYMRQTIILELPQGYMCSEKCKGLCPSCGVNWNEDTCSCKNERIDPRLADLALFFDKEKE